MTKVAKTATTEAARQRIVVFQQGVKWIASTMDDHHGAGATKGRALVNLGLYLDQLEAEENAPLPEQKSHREVIDLCSRRRFYFLFGDMTAKEREARFLTLRAMAVEMPMPFRHRHSCSYLDFYETGAQLYFMTIEEIERGAARGLILHDSNWALHPEIAPRLRPFVHA